MANNDDDDTASAVGYTNNVWDGELPSATGITAKEFEKTPTADQTTLASQVYTFLSDQTSTLTQLNAEQRLFTLLVNIPQSNIIKVIYGLGIGTSGIGEMSPNNNKILALTGEGNNIIGCPQALILPNTIREIKKLKCPTDTATQENLKTNPTNWYRLVQDRKYYR